MIFDAFVEMVHARRPQVRLQPSVCPEADTETHHARWYYVQYNGDPVTEVSCIVSKHQLYSLEVNCLRHSSISATYTYPFHDCCTTAHLDALISFCESITHQCHLLLSQLHANYHVTFDVVKLPCGAIVRIYPDDVYEVWNNIKCLSSHSSLHSLLSDKLVHAHKKSFFQKLFTKK